MFTINADQSINLTRGDTVSIDISATTSDNGIYVFVPGDVIRFKVFERSRCDSVVLVKDVVANEEAESVTVQLNSDDTRIGSIIHKPTEYWYEVELNPATAPQTIIGYDAKGPKVFRLYPEGDDN
jgi:hypothetical protein